jgi:hypothetical protein
MTNKLLRTGDSFSTALTSLSAPVHLTQSVLVERTTWLGLLLLLLVDQRHPLFIQISFPLLVEVEAIRYHPLCPVKVEALLYHPLARPRARRRLFLYHSSRDTMGKTYITTTFRFLYCQKRTTVKTDPRDCWFEKPRSRND